MIQLAGRRTIPAPPLATRGLAVLIVGVLAIAGCSKSGDKDEKPSSTTRAATADPAARYREAILTVAATGTRGQPEDVELPDVVDPDVNREYLEGDAKVLTQLLVATGPLAGDPSASTELCETVADDLRALGTPEELFDLAAGIADRPTREIAQNVVGSSGAALGACGQPTFGEEVVRLAFDWSLWHRRVQEVTG